MTTIINIFVITLTVNLALVFFGFNVDNQSDNFFEGTGADLTDVSNATQSAIDSSEFSASSANTGDPSQSDFKFIDALGVARAGLGMILSVFIAPMLMALTLDWPAFLIVFVAVPWTLMFWASMLLLIRGLT